MGVDGGAAGRRNWEQLALLTLGWFGLSIGYNYYNQHMKTPEMPFPWLIAVAQLPVGLGYAIPQWLLGLRKVPRLSLGDVFTLLPIIAMNSIGHTVTVMAMLKKGGGSLTHVIKSSEPVVVVLLNVVINQIVPKPLTALALLPVIYGVSYAATGGNLDAASMLRDLSTEVAQFAMVSNVVFALRSILRKRLSKEFKERTNLDSDNEFAVTTIASFLLVLPFAVAFESNSLAALSSLDEAKRNAWLFSTVACGLSFYGYNELQSKFLEKTDAVFAAVGNTLKRVAIFVGFYYLLNDPFPMAKTFGCAIAVLGCLVYGICDSMKI